MVRRFIAVFSLVAFFSVCCCAFGYESNDSPLLDGLRERQLYWLAERHVERQLARSDVSPRREVDLLVQQAITRTAIATSEPAGAREAAWQRAETPLDEFLQQQASDSLRLLVALQRALVDRTRGEVERHELRPGDDVALNICRDALRAAGAGLEQVARDANDLARDRALGSAASETDGLGAEELKGIVRGSQLELARTYRQLGLTYAAGSADRDDGLLQAGEQLQPLAMVTATDEVAWQARTEMLRVLAELGRASEGLSLLEKWTDPPIGLEGERTAAVGRLYLAAGDANKALQVLAAMPPGRSPECDFVRLELALSNGVDGKTIADLVATIRNAHAPAWARRAALLAGEQLAGASGGDATTRMLAGEHYFNARQFDLAREAYDEAGQLYRAEQNTRRSIDAEEMSAAISVAASDWPDAAARYRALAFDHPTNAGAAGWHRERLLALASDVRSSPADTELLIRFRTACVEHLQHWPEGPIADEVRVWLAQQQLASGDAVAALATTAAILPSSSQFEESVAVACRAYRQQAAATDSDTRAIAAAASLRLQPIITGSDNRWPQQWSTIQRDAALLLSDLRLRLSPPDIDYTNLLLSRAIDGSPSPEQSWTNRAAPLLAIALAAKGDAEGAINRLAAVGFSSDESTSQMLAMLATQLNSEPADSPFRGPLTEVIARVLDRLPPDSRLDKDRYRAPVLAERGNHAEALALYQQLVATHPRDGDLNEQYARLLAAGSINEKQQALAHWQRIESSSRRGGERWYRARLARVRLLRQLGQQDDAAKLVALTKVLQPEMGERIDRESR